MTITARAEKRERKTTAFGEKTGTHFTQIREPKYHRLQAKYRNVRESKYQNLHTKYRYRKPQKTSKPKETPRAKLEKVTPFE